MHRFGRVVIRNFRTCQDVDVFLFDITPLVGQNNAGKTTILRAIKALLSADAKADASDRADPSKPIELIGKIEGVTPAVLAAMANEAQKTAIAPFVENDTLWLRSSSGPDLKWKRTIWDPTSGVGPDGIPINFRDFPTGIQAPLRVLFPEVVHIEAMKNLEDDIAKAKAKSTMRELLDMLAGQVLAEKTEIQEAMDRVHALLTTAGNASEAASRQGFDDEASRNLELFFPGYGIETKFAPVKVEDFFKNAQLSVTEPYGPARPFDEVGAGTQRGIQMALVQMLGQRRTPTNAAQKILLLIDEPELFMHPQAARRIRETLKKLSTRGFQVVFTTHSPEMLSRETVQQTVVVRREEATGTMAKQPAATLVEAMKAKGAANSLFSLDVMADTFFSHTVVLTEGESDARMLRASYEMVVGIPPDVDALAFVPVDACTSIRPAQRILREMGMTAIAVADLDYLFKHQRDHDIHMTIAPAKVSAIKALVPAAVSAAGCSLGGDGWPQKKKHGPGAEEGWQAIAALPALKADLDALCQAARHTGVWFWREGSMEHAFGGIEKDEMAYTETIRLWTDGAAFRAAYPSVAACVDWIRGHLPNSAPIAAESRQ